MPRVARWILKGLLSLVAILAVVLVCALVYRAWRQYQAEATMRIAGANGIDETTFLRIGNTRQWISIRGQDRRNPVVLLVHGGPGASLGPMAPLFVPWERDYVVVQWDQPGAGRTFGEAGRVFDPSFTIERMAADGVQVAEYLRRHLRQERIILLGWSWGSALGLHMIKARPDLFTAFVGTGQIVNMKEGEALAYARVLAKARQRGDAEGVAELERIGPPPYEALQELGAQRKWASGYEAYATDLELLSDVLLAPRMSLTDAYAFVSGLMQSQNHFFGPSMNGPFVDADLRRLGLDFDIPVFVVQGTEDDYTPAALSRAYVDELRAPAKEFVPIEGAGHFAIVSRADEFRNAVTELLRRVAAQGLVIEPGSFTPIVGDIERSLSFYRDVLGMEVDREGQPSARVPGLGTRIEPMDLQQVPFETVKLRLQDPGNATLVLMVRDIDATLSRFKAARLPVVTTGGMPVSMGDGTRAVIVRDADNRFVELRQPPSIPADAPAHNIVEIRVMVTVADVPRTVQVYRDVFGFTVEGESPFRSEPVEWTLTGLKSFEERHARAKARDSQMWLEFVEFKGIDRTPLTMNIQDRGATRLQLRARNIDAVVEAARRAGLTIATVGRAATPMPPNSKGALVADPNNVFVSLVEPCDGCAPPPSR